MSEEGVWCWAVECLQTAVEPFEVGVSFQTPGAVVFVCLSPEARVSTKGGGVGSREGGALSASSLLDPGMRSIGG